MLAGTQTLLSLPETHILRLGIGRGGEQLFSCFRRKALLDSLQAELRPLTAQRESQRYFLSRTELVQNMVNLLDTAALEGGYAGWVEKTPEHIFYVSQIEAQFPDARFVHVVRDGRSVVASIDEMWVVYTEAWNRWRSLAKQLNDYSHAFRALRNSSSGVGKKVNFMELWRMKSLARACLLWNDCMALTGNCNAKSNHLAIDYDDITSNPAGELKILCEFLEIDFDTRMTQPEKNVLDLVNPHEKWKQGNTDPIRSASTAKYDSLPALERELVRELLDYSGDPNVYLDRISDRPAHTA